MGVVQARLNQDGAGLSVDQRYGRQTREAVRAFQAAHHLRRQDGIVGRETARAMGLQDNFDAPRRAGAATTGHATTGHAPRGRSTPATTAAQPTHPSAAPRASLLDPSEATLPPRERLTLLINRMAERIEQRTQQRLPLSSTERALANNLLTNSASVDDQLVFGGAVSELRSARERLRSAMETAPR